VCHRQIRERIPEPKDVPRPTPENGFLGKEPLDMNASRWQ